MAGQSPFRVVIVGSGQAGVETAAALRQRGFSGALTIVGEEPDLPYQRPPLSKDFLEGDDALPLPIKAENFYEANAIEMRLGERVQRIDRAARLLVLSGGGRIAYDHLVLATGARNRLPDLPGLQRRDIVELRTLAHALALRERLAALRHVTILGGGFIGLEVASHLRGRGIAVEMIEMSDRLMGRVVSPAMSDYFRAFHAGLGTRLRFGARAREVEKRWTKLAVRLIDGGVVETDALVVSIGVVPNDELAADAGLETKNGIVVDAHLLTSDPAISAIGDCAVYPNPFAGGGLVRLESVQNAIDQARCVAARLTGEDAAYHAVPWFWSNQGSARLLIAGLGTGADEAVTRGDPATGKFSVFLYRQGQLVCVESVNAPADHMAARRILAAGIAVPREFAADDQADLKTLLAKPRAPA